MSLGMCEAYGCSESAKYEVPMCYETSKHEDYRNSKLCSKCTEYAMTGNALPHESRSWFFEAALGWKPGDEL